jgi:hypothetical protein
MQWANGDEYKGHWQKGIKNGLGKMIWANDDTYDGNWVDDNLEGFGELQLGNATYKGNFKRN